MTFIGTNKLISPVGFILLSIVMFYVYHSSHLIEVPLDIGFMMGYNFFMIIWVMKILLFPVIKLDKKLFTVQYLFKKNIVIRLRDIKTFNDHLVSSKKQTVNLKKLGIPNNRIGEIFDKIDELRGIKC